MKFVSKSCCAALGAIVVLAAATAETNDWPAVQPAHERTTIVYSIKNDVDTPFIIFIRDTTGIPAYKLECHKGNYEDSSELNFSGDFQCALFAVKGSLRASYNLLATTEEQSSDWFNRGRMTSNQLWGHCGTSAEYGGVRHFKLRGMLLTLRFTDLIWAPPTNQNSHQLKEFTFDFSAISDKSAQMQAAEKTQAPKPSPSCF